jgi:hypothetical protein
MKKIYTVLLSSLSVMLVNAQHTFTQVHQLLQTKCSNATCHSASETQSLLKFDGDINSVYNAIINVTPENQFAKDRKDKLVKVNQPYESYLLRKVNYNFDTDLALAAGEGDSMVDVNGNPLSKKETELLRQWIMNGAKKTGNTVDTALVSAYYNDPTYPFLQKPIAPASGAGKRVRCGPIFIPKSGSGQEKEICLKYQLEMPFDAQIEKIDGYMNSESHHFLLFKFIDSAKAAQQPDGLRVINLAGGVTSFDGDKELTAAWQDNEEIDLPAGTALYWDKSTWLDLNYHVKNYGAQSVLPVDFYFNVYFEPRDPQTVEMKANLVNRATLLVPPGQSTQYYSDSHNGRNETKHIWMLTSHTHKYGVGFDIHELDQSKPNQLGNRIYDGEYNYKGGYSFGQYYYDHPPIRYFQPQHAINYKTSGMRVKTLYNNTSNNYVTFGFTTNEEMQLFYYLYTNEIPGGSVGIDEANFVLSQVAVYPNPISTESAIYVDAKEETKSSIYLTDISGKKVAQIFDGELVLGSNRFDLPATISKGIYFANITAKGKTVTRKFVVTE